MSQPGLHNAHELEPDVFARIDDALNLMPCCDFVMTARHHDKAQGVKVNWVQRMTGKPPVIVVVGVPKGSRIIPILQDAHRFALCQTHPDDKLTQRRFAVESSEDPFTALETFLSPGGAPVIAKSMAYIECELLRHVDFEGDHDMYMGLVHDGRRLHGGAPAVQSE